MEHLIFRRATSSELPRIIKMQSDIFHREYGLPDEDIDAFLAQDPVCWCVEMDGNICGAAAAWNERGQTHWGRFALSPSIRGMHIGTRLARFSFCDLFQMDVDQIYMTALDVTVNIVCGMGGQVIGESFDFFGNKITPVILEKKNFMGYKGNDYDHI